LNHPTQTTAFREEARDTVLSYFGGDRELDVALFGGSGSTAAIVKLVAILQIAHAAAAAQGANAGSHQTDANDTAEASGVGQERKWASAGGARRSSIVSIGSDAAAAQVLHHEDELELRMPNPVNKTCTVESGVDTQKPENDDGISSESSNQRNAKAEMRPLSIPVSNKAGLSQGADEKSSHAATVALAHRAQTTRGRLAVDPWPSTRLIRLLAGGNDKWDENNAGQVEKQQERVLGAGGHLTALGGAFTPGPGVGTRSLDRSSAHGLTGF